MRDFTLSAYGALLATIRQQELPVLGIAAWLQSPPTRGVLLRHDVDRKPKNALAMARLEHSLGIHSTYYFRVVGDAYDPTIIQAVAEMGHEVGYHYEDLALAAGDCARAHGLFARHLAQLRRLAPIRTIAMHGSPLSKFNNIDMWQQGSLQHYGLVADAFLSVDYAGMPYFTDTGRSWDGGKANLRDRPAGTAPTPGRIRSTPELCGAIAAAALPRCAISAHPERWAIDNLDWCLQLAKDHAVNLAKRILRSLR